MATSEYDEDGFPVAGPDNAGTLFTDEFEVVYVCEFEEAVGEWVWRTVGPRTLPPTEA